MAAKEIVLALRLSEGTTREQFRALKGTLIDVREEIAQNNKALKENAKAQREVDAALNEGKLTAEQAAVRTQKLTTAQDLLKTTAANLASQEFSLSDAYKRVLKDIGGASEGTDRFREAQVREAKATLSQRDALDAAAEKAKQLATVSKQLFDQYKGKKGTDEAFNAINTAINSATAALSRNKRALAENEKAEQQLAAEVRLAGVATEAQSARLQELATESAQLNAVNSSLQNSLGQLRGVLREVGNDTKGLTDAGLRFRDKMADANRTAIQQSSILQQLGARMDFLRTEQDRLNQEQKEGKITTEQYRAALDKLTAEEQQTAAETAKLTGVVDRLSRELAEGKITQDQFRAGIAGIDQSVKGVGSAVTQGVADLTSYALGFVEVVAVAQGAITAIKDIGKTVADFDQGLANIRALGEEFAGSIDKIGDAAIALGPKLGIAPVEALKGFEALAKAGLTTEQILSGGLESALTLAAAGTIEVGQAAEITAASLTQFNLQGEQAGLVADLLAKGANIAQGDVADFGAALNQTGLVANAYGLSIEETVGALTAFANAGLIGSDAGTSFKAALLRLQAPTAKAKELLDQYGIVLTDVNGNFKDLASVAGELQTKLSGLTQEQRSAALAQIFGQDAIRVANILYKEGAQGIAEYTKKVNETGFANQVAQEKLNSLSGAFDRLGASFDAVIVSIDKGDGIVSNLVRNLTDGAAKLLNVLNGTDKALGEAKIGARLAEDLGFFARGVERVKESFGALTLSSTDFAKRASDAINLVKDEVKAAGGDLTKLKEIQERLNKQLALSAGDAKATLIVTEQFKALTAGIKAASKAKEEEKKATEDLTGATDGETIALDAQGNAVETVAKKRERLNIELKAAQETLANTDATNDSAVASANRYIDALQNQINAIDGKADAEGNGAKKTKEQTDVEKEKITVTQALTKAEEDRTRAQEIAAKAKTIRAADPTITEPQAQAQAAAIIDSTARIKLFQGDADTIKRIEAQLQEDLAAIDAKFAADKVKNQDKANADLRTRNAALAQNELDALIERQNAELILAAKNGEDVNALAKTQAEARIALTQQIEDAAIAAKLESFDAEYAIAEQNGTDLIALTATQQEELAALKASFRENDVAKQLELNEQLKDADQALLEAKVDAAGAIGNALVTVAQQGSAAAKIGLAIQKAAAVAQVIVQTQYAIAAATAAAASIPAILPPGIPNPAFPIAQAISVAQIAKLKIGAGINIATIVAQAIAGFDEGGEVGSGNGTIKRSWGKPIRRKNGDNVLITAREGEKILNEDQQDELERLAGRDVWHRIGLPGAKYFGKTRQSFLEANGYAGGGVVTRGTALVNATAPVLTAIESVAEQRSFELNVVADIEEIVSVTNRRMAILETSRSR